MKVLQSYIWIQINEIIKISMSLFQDFVGDAWVRYYIIKFFAIYVIFFPRIK